MKRPIADRIQSKVDVVLEEDACWEWTAYRDAHGYGKLGGGRSGCWLSHRLIYALFVGPVPEDRQVMHLCSNRACVRPSHLRIGTHAENMRQKVREGNKSCGIPIPGPMKKLIRQRDLSVKDAARVFGVCPQTVRKIRREE